jgi:predicted nucleic acid-binding protein
VKLVVDTSVLIAVIANEASKPRLVEETVGATLLTPLSVHWEVGNAFSAMLKRKRISLDEALQALSSYRQIPLRFLDVELESAVRLVEKHGIYAYDAYVIAAAEQQRCPVLSLDDGLIRAARAHGVDVLEFVP